MKIVLKNAQLSNGERVDVKIENGLIVEMGKVAQAGIDCDG